MRFQGKRAVVTGGLSGIGEAVAKRIEAEGGKVAVWDMQGGIKTDISNWESVEAAAAVNWGRCKTTLTPGVGTEGGLMPSATTSCPRAARAGARCLNWPGKFW